MGRARRRSLMAISPQSEAISSRVRGFCSLPPTGTLAGFQAFGVYTPTGTVTLTNGSTACTGVGTHFTTELFVGCEIRLSVDSYQGIRIVTITDDTHLTLASTYGGTGGGWHAERWLREQQRRNELKGFFTSVADSVRVGDAVSNGGQTFILVLRIDKTHFRTNNHAWTTGAGHTTDYHRLSRRRERRSCLRLMGAYANRWDGTSVLSHHDNDCGRWWCRSRARSVPHRRRRGDAVGRVRSDAKHSRQW